MRIYLLLFLCIAVIASCTNKNKVPSGILPQNKMQELVWDVMVVEEKSKQERIIDTSKSVDLKKERSIQYQQVFDLHKTSRQEFVKSFDYYASRPDLTKTLFDTLTARSNRIRARTFRER